MDRAFFRASGEIEYLTSDNPLIFSRCSGLKAESAVMMPPLLRNPFLQALWVSKCRDHFVELPDSKPRLLNRDTGESRAIHSGR